MLKAAEGNDHAFESLVHRCQGGLIQYFTLLSGSPQEGEELAQEVFIRVYRKRKSYQASARFKTYLYHIAGNLWKDQLRGKKQNNATFSLDEPEQSDKIQEAQLAMACQPDSVLDRISLLRAVERLPQDQRAVLLLNHIEDLDYPEIAKILAVPLGTVKSRMHHAMRKLRSMLTR